MIVDFAADNDLDRIADIAIGLHDRMIENPDKLYGELVALAAQHPAKAAQVTMCLVAWFDPDLPCSVLWQRVEHLAALAGRRAS
ncbi:hypothetical protein [Mycobacterium sp. SMC-11]|uniref:hypothetical protein n=1 Tax=Mycobacterium sp. SMC-11 TaxID=3385969 RepID=UPI00390CBB49